MAFKVEILALVIQKCVYNVFKKSKEISALCDLNLDTFANIVEKIMFHYLDMHWSFVCRFENTDFVPADVYQGSEKKSDSCHPMH